MKFNELKKKRREGFTLVEMVVVVTILGVLSGLGFTKFEGVQAKAKENADYIAASNLATAANLYLNDNSIVGVCKKRYCVSKYIIAKPFFLSLIVSPYLKCFLDRLHTWFFFLLSV